MNDLLPIGSVVLLNGGTKKVMICGRLQRQSDTGELWDYSACLFPEGIINPHEMFLFNNEDVDRLYFIGMQDAEELEFRRYLIEQAETLRNGEEDAAE
ncbi:MAG: DUF4176 domain-containing protein [Clostridiales bacterium]|nr:DUF4176 domain-containing protein [Clostridiales bacterium]